MPGCRLLATAVTLGSLKIQPREPTSMPDMRDAIGVLLAGGQGERPVALDARSGQARGSFRGSLSNHRITLSNCVNSGLHRVFCPDAIQSAQPYAARARGLVAADGAGGIHRGAARPDASIAAVV